MKNTCFRQILFLAATAVLAVSCDGFLDVMPDNRTELNTREKIRSILVSAYPETDYMLLAEYSSDNVDDYGMSNPNTDRFIDQVFSWNDITENDNEGVEALWGSSYAAIGNANQAIAAIEEMGGAEKAGMKEEMAEALLCRAYNHFILVNVFASNYDGSRSDTDPGVTYMYAPETQLEPKYTRQSVSDIYKAIDEDLRTALPWVSDSYYTVPKYHFNVSAACAFAARFYLFYEKWDEAIRYADLCLGADPSALLRDWKAQASMTQDYEVLTNHYIDASLSANLLLITCYSKMGLCFGPYSTYSKYAHGKYLSEKETALALALLFKSDNYSFYYSPVKIYGGTNLDKQIFWKLPYLMEYIDPVAGIGYYRTVYPAFSTDQTLLERAEARILRNGTGDLDRAVDDINIWLNNISPLDFDLKVEDIYALMKDIPYSTWAESTVKKRLHPGFAIGDEGSVQESLLQFVLLLKRVDGLGQGLRWFDIKRYGIEVERRIINADGSPSLLVDRLSTEDGRRALQLPKKVIDAGYEKNSR